MCVSHSSLTDTAVRNGILFNLASVKKQAIERNTSEGFKGDPDKDQLSPLPCSSVQEKAIITYNSVFFFSGRWGKGWM